tara:strand:- start:80 stop:265 length:186 start_codon:yes stop_codon:yes gene_type:complete
MKKNKVTAGNIIGFIVGFGIVAIAQSKMGWTDGSWDFVRVIGAILIGGLPGWLFADGYFKG